MVSAASCQPLVVGTIDACDISRNPFYRPTTPVTTPLQWDKWPGRLRRPGRGHSDTRFKEQSPCPLVILASPPIAVHPASAPAVLSTLTPPTSPPSPTPCSRSTPTRRAYGPRRSGAAPTTSGCGPTGKAPSTTTTSGKTI